MSLKSVLSLVLLATVMLCRMPYGSVEARNMANIALGKMFEISVGELKGAITDGELSDPWNDRWFVSGSNSYKNAQATIDLGDDFVVSSLKIYNGVTPEIMETQARNFLTDFKFEYFNGGECLERVSSGSCTNCECQVGAWYEIPETLTYGFNDYVYESSFEQQIIASKIRLTSLQSQSQDFRIREIEIYGESLVNPNVALGKTVIAVPDVREKNPSFTVPQSLTNGITHLATDTEKWFVETVRMRTSFAIINLEKICLISHISVYKGYLNGEEMLTDFKVQYVKDGVWWDIKEAYVEDCNRPLLTIQLDTPLKTNAIRILPTTKQAEGYRLRELSVYGQATGESALLPEEINYMTLPIEPANRETLVGYTEIKLEKSNEVLLNPGKGWVLYGMPDSHTEGTLALGSIGYHRWNWNVIEPQEGQYRWDIIDDAIINWSNYGKQFAFRIMGLNPLYSENVEYQTPKWVFDAGAAYTVWTMENGVSCHVPVWDDEIYIEKLTNFTMAMAQRYDGNPNIAFIDMGGYGHFGENQLFGVPNSVSLDNEGLLRNSSIFLNAFKRTKIIVPIGHPSYYEVYQALVEQGAGVRHDGVMHSDPYMGKSAQNKEPVIFEFNSSFKDLWEQMGNAVWNSDRLRNDTLSYYPSYIGMGHWSGVDAQRMVDNVKPLLEELANRMGYHIGLDGVAVPNLVKADESAELIFDWRNAGVSYVYTPAHVAVALLNQAGNVVEKYWIDSANPRNWKPHAVTTDKYNISFGNVADGRYKLAVGLFLDKNNQSPDYLLANKNDDNGWYLITDNVVKSRDIFAFGSHTMDLTDTITVLHSSVTPSDGKLNVTATILNNSEAKVKSTIIIVLGDGKKMVLVKILRDESFEGIEAKTLSTDFTFSGDNPSIKIFCWSDLNALKPMSATF